MRWKETKVGEIYWEKKFALLPRKIGGYKIWLEFYYRKWVYRDTYDFKKRWLIYDTYLPESKEVQDYLLSKSPLAKAMKE